MSVKRDISLQLESLEWTVAKLTSFDLSRRRRNHVTQLVHQPRELGSNNLISHSTPIAN